MSDGETAKSVQFVNWPIQRVDFGMYPLLCIETVL